jgi:hypothetical protein
MVNMSASVKGIQSPVGTSSLFALTDVATASFLADLYSIPLGQTIKFGSNQSVVEFYHEVL